MRSHESSIHSKVIFLKEIALHIAIIGAGVSGLTCARQLQDQGHNVIVYEKSRDVSGRMSTRQTELGGFDHGAQYFTAHSEQFKEQVVDWRKAGWATTWDGKLMTLQAGDTTPVRRTIDRALQRLVAVPGMGALCQHLAQGLTIHTEKLVQRIEPQGAQWMLTVQSNTGAIDVSSGPFDAVVIAVPSDQAANLLQAAPQLAQQAEQVQMAPCWSLMMGFQEPLNLGYDGAWVEGSRLGWIAHDSSKPQRRPGEHWVAHATPAWSLEHVADDDERAKEKLLKAFHEATGTQVQPVYTAIHRWRYAQATQPLAGENLWDAKLRIGVCGDWFANGLEGGGRVENAYLSGSALARVMGGKD